MLRPMLNPMLKANLNPILSAVRQAIEYVARFDGVTQYINSENLTGYSAGDSIFIMCSRPTNSFATLISNSNNAILVRKDNQNRFSFGSGCGVFIDGVEVFNGDPWPDKILNIEVLIKISTTFPRLLVRSDLLTGFFAASVYRITDTLGNIFEMSDGWANNPVMKNSGTGSDLIYVNLTSESWGVR